MQEQRVTLWCKVLGKLVEVSLMRTGQVRHAIPGVSEGWGVADCLDKDVECFGKGCPFTTDGGEVPFGEIGEMSGQSSESFDPMAEPGFEGEWS